MENGRCCRYYQRVLANCDDTSSPENNNVLSGLKKKFTYRCRIVQFVSMKAFLV